MPPAASRATAAAAGRAKAAASKQTVQIRGKRKSIATDPALLQGSSDEDGEGPQDHEELPNSLQEQPAQRLNSKSISSKSSAKHKKTVLGASDGDVSTSSPRRSTRLSGEGVVGSQYTTAGASTSRNARNRRDDPSQSRETLPGSKTPSALGNKRKAPSSGTAPKTAASTHPTPPETDSDTASRRQPSRSRTQSSTDRQSPKPKKLKGTSGETSQPTQTVSTDRRLQV